MDERVVGLLKNNACVKFNRLTNDKQQYEEFEQRRKLRNVQIVRHTSNARRSFPDLSESVLMYISNAILIAHATVENCRFLHHLIRPDFCLPSTLLKFDDTLSVLDTCYHNFEWRTFYHSTLNHPRNISSFKISFPCHI